jgi:hypothetical protein
MYAAIEQAVVMNWLAGVDHTRVGPIAFDARAMRATILDFSSIVRLPAWKMDTVRKMIQGKETAAPSNANKVFNVGSYETGLRLLQASEVSEDGAAHFLRRLYDDLPPRSNPEGRAALVGAARDGAWKCALSMS